MKVIDIDEFDFSEGKVIAGKYKIIENLGSGLEGEVYRILEMSTGIERAAKFFFPKYNPKNQTAVRYAKLLHKLNSCPIVIQYHTHEFIRYNNTTITCLISEFVDGELFSDFLRRQPGKYIGIFRGLQLLHALASGLELMHHLRCYHGDLHTDNIIVKRYGLGFELKLLDMYNLGRHSRETMYDDICDSIRVFYDAIGGKRRYYKQPKEIKYICSGLKRSIIMQKFKTAGQLREHLENIDWQTSYRE